MINYKIHCKYQFGEFVQVVEKSTNLIEVPRTINALAIFPTRNEQGSLRYFDIKTGKPLTRKSDVSLIIPENIPARTYAFPD